MRSSLIVSAVALTTLFIGSVILPGRFSATTTLAQEMTQDPFDCPRQRIGKGLPYHVGTEMTYEAPERVSLTCQYRRQNIRAGAPSASMIIFYYGPSATTKSIPPVEFCWQVRGETDPEYVSDRQPPGGVVFPGDAFIRVQYSALNVKAIEAVRAFALESAEALIDEGRVLPCPGASLDPSSEETAPNNVLGAAARDYLAAAERFRVAVEAADQLQSAALDATSDPLAVAEDISASFEALASAAASYASELQGLTLPPEAQARVEDLIAAAMEQERLWQLLAGDLSPDAVEEAGFDDPLAVADAVLAAITTRESADEALRAAFGLPPSGAADADAGDDTELVGDQDTG